MLVWRTGALVSLEGVSYEISGLEKWMSLSENVFTSQREEAAKRLEREVSGRASGRASKQQSEPVSKAGSESRTTNEPLVLNSNADVCRLSLLRLGSYWVHSKAIQLFHRAANTPRSVEATAFLRGEQTGWDTNTQRRW